MKPKRQSLPSLIAKADKLTSDYIRQKYADDYGNVTCITCGKVLHWKESHCAHYIERGSKATRWLEENLHPADCSCNVFHKEFHKREYTLYMIDMYGRDKISELKILSRKVLKPTEVRQLAEDAIDYYGKALKELNKQ
jgi:hypothetical protein